MKRPYLLTALFLFSITLPAATQAELGEKVPNFSTTDHEGNKWTLKKAIRDTDYLVVYFYPAAFTGGCTKQACSYRDHSKDLKGLNAKVVGVSGDSPETLEMFAREHELNYTLLADEDGKIARLFEVPQRDGGVIEREIEGQTFQLARGTTIQRWTFILDGDGELIYKDAEVNAVEDSRKVLEFLSSL